MLLEKFFATFYRNWYTKNKISPEITKILDQSGSWKKLTDFNNINKKSDAKKYALMSVKDPSSLDDYHGLIVSHYTDISPITLNKIKGIIVMNRAFLPLFGSELFSDKLLMSKMFDTDERLKKIKPIWKSYTKGYSQQLIDQINQDIPGDIIVIKPRVGLQGRGIIILRKMELSVTLQYIFSGDPVLKKTLIIPIAGGRRILFQTSSLKSLSSPIQ